MSTLTDQHDQATHRLSQELGSVSAGAAQAIVDYVDASINLALGALGGSLLAEAREDAEAISAQWYASKDVEAEAVASEAEAQAQAEAEAQAAEAEGAQG